MAALKTSAKPVGFALYVGISEADAHAAGLSIAEIATALKAKLTELLPDPSKPDLRSSRPSTRRGPGEKLRPHATSTERAPSKRIKTLLRDWLLTSSAEGSLLMAATRS